MVAGMTLAVRHGIHATCEIDSRQLVSKAYCMSHDTAFDDGYMSCQQVVGVGGRPAQRCRLVLERDSE